MPEEFNHFPEIADQLDVKMHEIIHKVAHDIQATAAAYAPVRTGYLKNSIIVQSIDVYEAQVTVGAEYGMYVELGTRYMSAQPYFYPAVDMGSIAFEQAVGILAAALG